MNELSDKLINAKEHENKKDTIKVIELLTHRKAAGTT
jgi:hypothetical protein